MGNSVAGGISAVGVRTIVGEVNNGGVFNL